MADVLVVDDDLDLCAAVEAVIGHMGLAVESAGTLREGLERSRARLFKAVILDVWLPDANALEHIQD